MDALCRKVWPCLVLILCLFAGCEGWSGSFSLGKSDAQSEDDSDIGLDEDLQLEEVAPAAAETPKSSEEVATASHTTAGDFEPNLRNADGEYLTLNLKVGEKFPLVKNVSHTLLQQGGDADRSSRSRLEMTIVLTVSDHPESGPKAGAYLLDVKYHKVKYEQDLFGQKLHFDSESTTENVPSELQTYQRLVGNGFSFWLKPDNQIGELIGFDEFLKRCLEGAVPNNQLQEKSLIANATGTEGLANFVDDSIGLLPRTAIKMGDTWSVDRQVLHPIAMKISSRYSLTNIDETTAEIGILGQVAPIASASSDDRNRPLNVVVDDGQIFGSCTIDRRSGLPIHSQVNQEISMRVKMPDHSEFRQRKQSITTIRAFAPQGPSVSMGETGAKAENAILQTSGNGPSDQPRATIDHELR